MRPMPLLLLLLTAAGAVTGVAILFDDVQLSWGLAIAQMQLAAAATVLLRRGLPWRMAVLLALLFFWASALNPRHDLDTYAFNLMLLLSVILFTAAWCGLLTFGGWRLAVPSQAQTNTAPPYQFSLATLMLSMGIAGVFGGCWQWLNYSYLEYSAVMLILLCSLAGCTMFKISSRGTWPWLPAVVIPAIVVVVINLPFHRYLLHPEWMLRMLPPQIVFLFATLTTLRIAGCYLQRTITLPASAKSSIDSPNSTIDPRSAIYPRA